MKKLLCLLLTAFMLISLCSCFGDKKDEDVRGEIISGDNTQTENNTDKDADTDINTDANTETENEPEFSMGKVSSNTYNNDFLGLSCTLPSEWVFYTEEQILEINNIVGDVVDENAKKQLENATIIYDMYASYISEGSSINVNLEKLNAVQAVTLNIKNTLEGQIGTIKSAYENMGYTDMDIGYQKVTVDGKEFDALKFTAKIQGIDFYGITFSFIKENYLASIAVCSILTDKNETILGYFDVK